MIPGVPVSSFPQSQKDHHEGTHQEWFQALEYFEPTFMEAHEALKMILKVRSLKSQIKQRSFLQDIITFSNEVLKDIEFNMVVRNRELVNTRRETAER